MDKWLCAALCDSIYANMLHQSDEAVAAVGMLFDRGVCSPVFV